MDPGTEIGPKPVCREAPLSTFDGTLISGMSFGTLILQAAGREPITAASADKGTIIGLPFSMRVSYPMSVRPVRATTN
jgi:hypothetical protein